MSQSFLFLQGTASSFFATLAGALRSRGHSVERVNFCGGDRLYAGEGKSVDYRGTLEDLGQWYEMRHDSEGFTDIIMFGDCRPVHQPVHHVAKKRGVKVHVFEEGYVRPDWLTLERHGVNGRSEMPRDAQWFVEQHRANQIGSVAQDTGYSLSERAWHDIRYRMANAALAKQYPHYQNHRPRNGCVEYLGLASRFARQSFHRRHAAAVTHEVLESKKKYFLFPLQLGSDAQIVVHSNFSGIAAAIERVVSSFAQHADADAMLVIKNHPLDTGLIDYHRYSNQCAERHGVALRLRFINGGHLPTLLENARGVVVVNSTVGLSALHHKRPVVALGAAIYNFERLTWQGGLDGFWAGAREPDMDVYWSFLDYIIRHTQINGNFYTRTGIAMAVNGAVRRLEEGGNA